ncbi:uncharacterized protein KY384_002780 [Bacidia gigantensis]|uniref:uncharacterized protein n=1 Tax=Bacidia gigantensis TaxID=2732470 RepID=UPI001D0472EC|nr:uncharacterized protein KY384_002780 [Bacidia gigantensis]KAG8532902.1 hypothetical protein KY384_002780 [Bacidia gigantensis]
MGEQNLFAECKAILYHDDSVPVGTLEIRSAATTPTSPTFVVNDTEASDTSAIQMETAKRSYPGNITLSEDARKWRFAVQKPPFRIEEWRLMTGLIAAAQYTLTLEQARFQSFVWDDDGRNLDLLLQSTLKFEDADKRALTQLTILKTISAIIEEEYSLAIKNREFRVVNFKIIRPAMNDGSSITLQKLKAQLKRRSEDSGKKKLGSYASRNLPYVPITSSEISNYLCIASVMSSAYPEHEQAAALHIPRAPA